MFIFTFFAFFTNALITGISVRSIAVFPATVRIDGLA